MHVSKKWIAPLAAALLLVAALPATAATTHVTVKDSKFDPDVVRLSVGDSIHWMSGDTRQGHNVRESGKLFYSGSAPSNNISYSAVFSAGTFRYYCEFHKGTGMRGRVNVPVSLGADPAGFPFTVTWATSSSETGSKYDVEYRVGSGSWKKWKTDVTAGSAVFGKGGPVKLTAGKSYSLRARSQKGSNVSGWSPVRSQKV